MENQATVDTKVLFVFKPIGLPRGKGDNRIHQAEIGIEVMTITETMRLKPSNRLRESV